jgi:hypothetical protein
MHSKALVASFVTLRGIPVCTLSAVLHILLGVADRSDRNFPRQLPVVSFLVSDWEFEVSVITVQAKKDGW